MSDTPRVDALVAPFDRASREHPELVALARQLERELATQMRITTQLMGAIRQEFLADVDRRDDFKWPL